MRGGRPDDGLRRENRRRNADHGGIAFLAMTCLLINSCAGLGDLTGSGDVRPPTFPSIPPSVPAADIFGTAIEEVCFEALATGQHPAARIRDTLFDPAPSVRQSLKSTPADRLYAASFASAPVVLSLPNTEHRCDVIAVRGDRDALRRVAEDIIARSRNILKGRMPDYLITLDESPQKGYVLKFSLFAVGETGAAGTSLRGRR